jgi:signal transduction histidine kinase
MAESSAAVARAAAKTRERSLAEARIVVISDDREFVNSLVESWDRLRYSPEFAVCSVARGGWIGACAVAVAEGIEALTRLEPGVVLAIAVCDEALPKRCEGVRLLRIASSANWADQAAVLAQEALLRLQSQAQIAEIKQRMREMERYATLGRFIVEARHALGNALTGVLGHSELLLLEENGDLPGKMRSQLETIRSMSLKIHETFHRLSSLDLELRAAEQETEWDARGGMPR